VTAAAARAVALGLLHGPLELLPVSSSAHVALLTGDAPSKELEVALHAGTLLALGPPRPRAWLVLATTPAAVAGALLERPIEERLGTRATLPFGLVAGAVALALADACASNRGSDPSLRVQRDGCVSNKGSDPLLRVQPADAVAIGLAQAAALVPGVSRHGAALAAARARGFARPAAHAISREAGRPVLLGATALKLVRLARRRDADLAPLALGLLASWASTRAALRALPAATAAPLWPFAAYRVALAAAIRHERLSEGRRAGCVAT